MFEPKLDVSDQPEQFQIDITQRWIDWAAQNGDKTYLKYRSTPLIPPYVLYHDSIHSEKDFPVPSIDTRKYGEKGNACRDQKQSISVI